MPKMTRWNSPEPVDVPAEKVAVYAAQGWMSVDKPPVAKVQPGVTREATQEVAETAKVPVKKAAAKKTAKKP